MEARNILSETGSAWCSGSFPSPLAEAQATRGKQCLWGGTRGPLAQGRPQGAQLSVGSEQGRWAPREDTAWSAARGRGRLDAGSGLGMRQGDVVSDKPV